MSVMYLLILLSLILATGFVIAFVWAIRSGQYDDKYTPSVRMLFDDEPAAKSESRPVASSEKSQSSNPNGKAQTGQYRNGNAEASSSKNV
jgi:cbb3-type cytochrome oxidase maturation protein